MKTKLFYRSCCTTCLLIRKRHRIIPTPSLATTKPDLFCGMQLGTFLLSALLSFGINAYPLDAEEVGIRRIHGFKPEVAAKGAPKHPLGALLSRQQIKLHLTATGRDWDIEPTNRDPQLQQALELMLKERDPSYGAVVIDVTRPDNIVWAGVREYRSQIPGSVGKVLTMLGFFSELAHAFPDPAQRRALLTNHIVVAGEWVNWDEHKVPRYDPVTNTISKAVIQVGESFRLAEWLDHMIASSANSAAATIWKETILLRAFGSKYPPSAEQEQNFFRETKKNSLWELASLAISEPMLAAGLDSQVFWVGSFWTRTAKNLVPGNGNSRATALAFAKFLLRLEQGRLIDEWSSLEMKYYLYTTTRRYRYVYPPELANTAVYFKSGSLYRCRPEAEFSCRKYQGNVDNAMNSIAIIESPATPIAEQKRYIVSLMSNVLRKNSAWDHARIGAAVESLIQTRATVQVDDQGSEAAMKAAGGQD